MLPLLMFPVGAGILLGYAIGGRLSGLAAVRFRALWLLWLATLIQAVQLFVAPVRRLVEDRWGVPMMALVFATVAAWLAVGLARWSTGMRLAAAAIAAGAALNGLAIGLNGRMPYAPTAAAHAGLRPGVETAKNEPAGTGTRLAVLGDRIPVAPLRTVVSAGDLLIGSGVAALITVGMRRRRPAGGPVLVEGGEP